MKDTLKILHLHFNANFLVCRSRIFFLIIFWLARGWDQDNSVRKIFEGFFHSFFKYFFHFIFKVPVGSIIFSQQHIFLSSFCCFLRNHSGIACPSRALTHLCKLRIFEGKTPHSWQTTSVFSHLRWFSQTF